MNTGISVVVFLIGVMAGCVPDEPTLHRAVEQIESYINRDMMENNTPGFAIAVTDREGIIYRSFFGYADLKKRQQVTEETLFQIGSISKSFTALALLQLFDEGKFDPERSLTEYLPWFRIQTEYEPITPHHLITHTAGIPRDRDDIPPSWYSAYALREQSTAYPPGTQYSYSNIGYQTLGILLEALERKSYAEILQERILDPIGMSNSSPVITHDIRKRLAVGYTALHDDRPWHPSYPIVEASFFEYTAGDGSVAATPEDLAAYLRVILNKGALPDGRQIITEESFNRFIEPAIAMPGGESPAYYGYGITVREENGRTIVSHGGGMVGYRAMMIGDLDSGLGVVTFVNGSGNPGAIARYALEAVRAAVNGEAIPEIPKPSDRTTIENAEEYTGRYTSPDGDTLKIEDVNESMFLVIGNERILLEQRGNDRFYTPGPRFNTFLILFNREDETVTELFHGDDWYINENYEGPLSFDYPDSWNYYPGHYRTQNPWFNNFRIVLRKGELYLVTPPGGESKLSEIEPGVFQVGQRENERLILNTIVDNKSLRAWFSGVSFYRTMGDIQ